MMASQKGKPSKHSEDTSSKIGKFYRRLRGIQPSTAIIAAIVIGYAIFIFSGGLFSIINHDYWSYYNGSKFYFVLWSISDQFVSEVFIAGIMYALGFLGLLAMYMSTKNAYNPRQAYMLLLVGVALVVTVYFVLDWGIIPYKLAGTP